MRRSPSMISRSARSRGASSVGALLPWLGSVDRPRRVGPAGPTSAAEAGVLELVELGPAGEQVDDALDGAAGDGGVAVRRRP